MTRVIHTGDTHLGYRQYHSPERRADFLAAFEQVIDDAIAEDVDAVIHAGDLFHDRRPDLQALHGTIGVLRKLRDADIPFLAVVGNHEGTRGRQWLDLFEMLGLATRLGDDPEIIGETAFYGLDHVPKSKREDLEYEFADHDQPHAALVSHGLFKPFEPGDWDAEEVLTQASVDFDAMLLGDNHIPDTREVADTWVTYCGSTERCSTAEREDRGYNIVEFDGEVAITRRGLDATRDFAFIDVDLGEDEGIERVRETVREYDLEDAVAVVEIDGDGEDVTPARVEEFALDEGALVARIKDRREIEETDDEVEVSFADPDDAVRERVRDLGLSEAARDVDETVRASKVADSNVRESVRNRVSALMDEGDLSAFESASEDDEVEDGGAEDAEAESDASAEDESPPDETADETSSDGATATQDGETQTDAEGVAVTATAAADAAENGADGNGATANADAEEEAAETEPTEKGTPDASAPDSDGDGQSSMEEYL